MRKNITLLLVTIIIMSLLIVSIAGCTNNNENLSQSIHFDKITNDELNFNHLETNSSDKVTLIENNVAMYKIVNVPNSTPSMTRAIAELKDTLDAIGNTHFEVIDEVNSDISGLIYINANKTGTGDKLHDDGFVIDINEDNIYIEGNTIDASRNGIYYFLEEYLGVVFVSPEDTFIPKHNNVYLKKGSSIHNPVTPWRGIYAYETADNYWASKLLLNSINVDSADDEIAESIITKESTMNLADKDKYQNIDSYNQKKKINENRNYNEWGTWCHSMYNYLSPEEYFDTHPEYFSMFEGKRTHYYKGIDAHLCLSNPEVYDIVERSLGEKIKAHPEVKYWDFSANDNWYIKGCECDRCKQLDKAAGGTGMGTLLPFINKLADKYPNVCISTLAYNHTLKAPTNGVKPRSNVVIKLCSMPGDQASSYKDPTNNDAKLFHDQMKEWSAITDKIVVWDYTVNFANLLLPFPNFAVQQDNQKFYEDNNIQGIFHQSSREKGGELTTLRAYTLSKLMWQGSSLDYAKSVSRYVYAYYGDAGIDVINYLNDMQDALAKNSAKLGLYDRIAPHYNGYLSESMISKYEKDIDSAKSKVKDNQKYLDRVEELELNVLYAKIQNPDITNDERNTAMTRMKALADKQGVTMSQEWQSLDDFTKNIDNELRQTRNTINLPRNIALGVVFGIVGLVGIIVLIVILIKKKKAKIINNDNIE